MKFIIVLLCAIISGCTVFKTVETGVKSEVAGFQEDWQRTFGNGRTN
jgi:hypothetical protein